MSKFMSEMNKRVGRKLVDQWSNDSNALYMNVSIVFACFTLYTQVSNVSCKIRQRLQSVSP